jgi:hypothetical protein
MTFLQLKFGLRPLEKKRSDTNFRRQTKREVIRILVVNKQKDFRADSFFTRIPEVFCITP